MICRYFFALRRILGVLSYEKVYVSMLLCIDDEGFMELVVVECMSEHFDIDKIMDERNALSEYINYLLMRKNN